MAATGIRAIEARLINSLPQHLVPVFYTNEPTNYPRLVYVSDERLFYWLRKGRVHFSLDTFRIVSFKLGWTRNFYQPFLLPDGANAGRSSSSGVSLRLRLTLRRDL